MWEVSSIESMLRAPVQQSIRNGHGARFDIYGFLLLIVIAHCYSFRRFTPHIDWIWPLQARFGLRLPVIFYLCGLLLDKHLMV